MRIFRLLLLPILAAPLYAQLAPPAGWTSQNTGNAIVMRSAAEDPSAQVALTLLPPGRPIGETKAWFARQVLALAQAAGRPTGTTEVMEPKPGILVRAVQVENQNHVKLRQVFYGYPVAHGIGGAVLTIPPPSATRIPRWKQPIVTCRSSPQKGSSCRSGRLRRLPLLRRIMVNTSRPLGAPILTSPITPRPSFPKNATFR